MDDNDFKDSIGVARCLVILRVLPTDGEIRRTELWGAPTVECSGWLASILNCSTLATFPPRRGSPWVVLATPVSIVVEGIQFWGWVLRIRMVRWWLCGVSESEGGGCRGGGMVGVVRGSFRVVDSGFEWGLGCKGETGVRVVRGWCRCCAVVGRAVRRRHWRGGAVRVSLGCWS
ncbi:hypothetical protein GQ457_02G033040 [Hibiscus cannabinus]